MHEIVAHACDALDGIVDNVVSNYAACTASVVLDGTVSFELSSSVITKSESGGIYVATGSASLALGSSETLNLYMYPREDLRGRQESAWLAEAIDQAESKLRSVDFADPDR